MESIWSRLSWQQVAALGLVVAGGVAALVFVPVVLAIALVTLVVGAAGQEASYIHPKWRQGDNVVYRMGFGSTRAEARQLVTHCAIMVNGRLLNVPSAVLPSSVSHGSTVVSAGSTSSVA